jgi:hypothetical protein
MKKGYAESLISVNKQSQRCIAVVFPRCGVRNFD